MKRIVGEGNERTDRIDIDRQNRFVQDAGVHLAEATVGMRLRISFVNLDGEASTWLGAVGLCLGEEVVVVRRAAFGGPLHVKLVSGGEFAVARELARNIRVEATTA